MGIHSSAKRLLDYYQIATVGSDGKRCGEPRLVCLVLAMLVKVIENDMKIEIRQQPMMSGRLESLL